MDVTLTEFLNRAIESQPHRTALVHGETRLTYQELGLRTRLLQAGLTAAGISKGDIVSVQLPNCPEFVLLQLALASIGAVMQPIHLSFRRSEVSSQLAFCGSVAYVCPGTSSAFDFVDMAQNIWPSLPALKQVIVVGGTAPENMLTFDEIIHTGEKLDPHTDTTPDDFLLLNFTSGTEGTPKGFLHSHNTILGVSAREVAEFKLGPDDVFLSFSPMSHTFGHMITYMSIIAQGTLVLVDRYSPTDSFPYILRERVTYLQGTPAHLIGFMQHPAFVHSKPDSLRLCFVGGAPVPVQLMREIRDQIGCDLINAYGQGENVVHTLCATYQDSLEAMYETVGRPFPGAEIRIASPANREDTPTGEAGEIAYRGPSLCLGYYKSPELTASTRDEEGWFYTGDLGALDAKGYLHLKGRIKDVINRGGTKIFPIEIENLLLLHPKVLYAAVIGMPDYRLGERVCAYISLKAGEIATSEELAEHLRQHQVSKYKLPERFEFIDTVPMNPSGKIMKAALVENITKKLAQEAGIELLDSQEGTNGKRIHS